MSHIDAKRAQQLIADHAEIAQFGSSADAVEEAWIDRAETALGRQLPESYKWFLRNYAGGEIGGEEVFSIYGKDFDTLSGGDIVVQNRALKRAGLLDTDKVIVCRSDVDGSFYFDYSRFDAGECPICQRLPSGAFVDYAADFYEFLARRIEAFS